LALSVGSAFADDGRPFHFENDVSPVLSRYGCNSSGCHGKAEGQGGFKLSVFAFDPAADHAAVVKEGRGRRVVPAAPDESLLLLKASGRAPHGGGVKLPFDSPDYRTLRNWIAAGMPVGDPNAPRVVALRVEPAERVAGMRERVPLTVRARYADGREVDVTCHARFQSNHDGLAAVSADGVIATASTPGEVAVMAAYQGHVGLCRVIIPRPGAGVKNSLPQFNVVDELVDRKLAKLNVAPSPVCDDATFLRRAHLDLIGLPPTPAEVRAFLADTAADKRATVIDRLLERAEFADLMALRWADLLRVDRLALGHPRAYAYYRWIRTAFADNTPFDRFARDLIAAEGPLADAPAGHFYQAVPKPGDAASGIAQVFLGVRIACAQCHHHPSDRWTQTDYAGLVAYFAPVSVQGEAVVASGEAAFKHPRTGEAVSARPLGASAAATRPAADRRPELVSWMTSPDNPYFARNLANRVWADLLGRGIVEPVDDVRATNPPSNPELLDALARYVVEKKYDVRELVRLICRSRVYQTSSAPNETNEKDEQNFSRGLFKRPPAEVLLDLIGTATGVRDRFAGLPAGTRAVQVWDSQTKHEFLKLFGRPERTTACACERTTEPSTAQVLNLLNSAALQKKLSHEAGTVARLVAAEADDGKLIDELYLTAFARPPTAAERAKRVEYLAGKPDRRKATEDVLWAMLNSLEFLFNH
jgi:hypothetical protein